MALPRIEVPTYQLTQPSTGKLITYRPFLVKEHKVLLTMAEADNEEVIRIVKDLVDVCTFNKLDVKNLPHFDIEYIFMNLRAKSISEVVEVIITCINCEETYDATFSIDNLQVEKGSFTDNKVKINQNIFIELAYPKIDSVIRIYDNNDTQEIIELVKNSIVAVYDENTVYEAKDQTKEEIEDFVLSLTKEQFGNIEEFFVQSPRIVQTIETDCPKCKHHNTSRLQGLQNFFV